MPDYEVEIDCSTRPDKLDDDSIKGACPLSEIAYYCHTSGTSSSLPKPIPQLHKGVVGALCGLLDNSTLATFSTTPLYHGGLPDCFRAWTSGAMVWFFPEGLAPITGTNVLKAIEHGQRLSTECSIHLFSSVPYVLQMLAEDEAGVDMLRRMDIVGVGGAALPTLTGNKLVTSGVNLVSRLGSAECGFLMSSHRDYATDKDWEYLRPVQDASLMQFEPAQDGLSELVIKPSWPCLVKTNRDDGSYATADLFEPHASIPNAWRYHSRADAQITLSNGKKFDPSPIEARILESTSTLRDVFIFGAGQDYPGALLFPKSGNDRSDQELQCEIWPIISEMNSSTQNHAQLSRSMLRVVSVPDGEQPLEKSSKGTILRGRANERYGSIIDAMYSKQVSLPLTPKEDAQHDLHDVVTNCFEAVLGRRIDPDKDVYQQGIDSIACIRIRKSIERSLPSDQDPLPLNIVYDSGTINGLIKRLQQDPDATGGDEQDNSVADTMIAMAEKYSNFNNFRVSTPRCGNESKKHTVVLTGATGFLGARILSLLLRDERVAAVCCLVRAETSEKGRERVSQALRRLQIVLPDKCFGKTLLMPWYPDNANTELSEADMSSLESLQPTVFIHSAWAVNFSLNLNSFENQVAGTHSLLRAAATLGSRFVFVSSIAAVANSPAEVVSETISHDPHDASPLGYSQSKWVTEKVCVAAQRCLAERLGSQSLDQAISIVRVGQLCADETGVWNMSEAFPLMLSTAAITGCLPDLPDESLSWLPVDQAAKSVIEAATLLRNMGDLDVIQLGTENNNHVEDTTSDAQVLHVLNPHASPSWQQYLHWIQQDLSSDETSVVGAVKPSVWVQRLSSAIQEKHPDHPAQSLLGMWQDRFGSDTLNPEAEDEKNTFPVFDTTRAKHSLSSMRDVHPLSRERAVQIWRWVQAEGEKLASKSTTKQESKTA